ncbi:MAG: hypothetical protein ACRYFU_18410 [Janthinobacterium lividum]
MNRRRFTLAALFPATLVTGCHSDKEPKPSLDATLFHNAHVREAMDELDQAMNGLEMRIGQFNAENWQDALTNTQTAAIRLRNVTDELKRSLGYAETS